MPAITCIKHDETIIGIEKRDVDKRIEATMDKHAHAFDTFCDYRHYAVDM